MPVLQSDNCYQPNIYLQPDTTGLVFCPFVHLIIFSENCNCGVEGNTNRIVNGDDVPVNKISDTIKTKNPFEQSLLYAIRIIRMKKTWSSVPNSS